LKLRRPTWYALAGPVVEKAMRAVAETDEKRVPRAQDLGTSDGPSWKKLDRVAAIAVAVRVVDRRQQLVDVVCTVY
jgi:hypothetical protein